MAIKSLSIRIDEALLDKLHVVANYEGRSANGQILVLIRKCVEEYEAKDVYKRQASRSAATSASTASTPGRPTSCGGRGSSP